MQTITLTGYEVSELSENAKENAYNNWLQNADYPFWKDNEDVLYEFADIFNISIRNYQYDENFSNVSYEINEDEEILNLSGIRLLSYIWNNYKDVLYIGKYRPVHTEKKLNHPRITQKILSNGKLFQSWHSKIFWEETALTGYFVGCEMVKPIFDFMENPDKTTFKELLEECITNWEETVNEDVRSCSSIESFEEDANINQWLFSEKGELI